MDIYLEKHIKRKQTTGGILFLVGITLLGIILSFFLLSFNNPIMGFLIAGIIFVIFYAIKLRKIEFEYIFTNNLVDIDIIMGGARRKRSLSFDIKRVKVWGVYSTENYERYESKASKLLEAVTSMEDEGIYFVLVDLSDTETIAAFLQLDEEMVELMEKYASDRKIA